MKRRNFIAKSLKMASAFTVAPLIVAGCGKENSGSGNPDPEPEPGGGVFMAGASRVSIIPPQDQIPGTRKVVKDTTYVRSLLLDDGRTKLLLVVLDLVGFGEYNVGLAKQKIKELTNIPESNIMISVTHTHSAILTITPEGSTPHHLGSTTFIPYRDFVVDKIAESAAIAVQNLAPAKIGWGKAEVPDWIFNRRYQMSDYDWKTPFGDMENVMYNPPNEHSGIVEPLGPIDSEISFISVQSIDGKPVALFANYSAHYPVDLPSTDISADFYGVFSNRIAELLNVGSQSSAFVGALSMGTGGDQNSINRQAPRPPGTGDEIRKRMGDDIARAVYTAHRSVQHKTWVTLGAIQSSIQLGVRKATAEQLAYGEFLLERERSGLPPLNHPLETSLVGWINIMSRVWPSHINATMQAFRVGDLAVAAIPFEVFAETGLSIKQKSPFQATFTNGMSNGSFGYLPTARQLDLGAYETWIGLSNKVERDAAEKIENEILSLLSRLYE